MTDLLWMEHLARMGTTCELQPRTNLLVWTETKIHARTLDEYERLAVATAAMVQGARDLHRRERGRLLREGASEMTMVRTRAAVKRRLHEHDRGSA